MAYVFELLLVALVLQSFAICWLAFRQRKPDKKEDPEDEVRQLGEDTDLVSRSSRTRSNYKYYVIWKSEADNSVPTGIYRCTWDEIIDILPNHRFPAKGIRLKGANSLDEACRIWKQCRYAEVGI